LGDSRSIQFFFRTDKTKLTQIVADYGVGFVEKAAAAGDAAAMSLPIPTCCAPCPGNRNAIIIVRVCPEWS
jgi:hypothetical protein